MKTKKLITTILLIFVFASIAYLVANELNSQRSVQENKPDNLSKEPASSDLTNQYQPTIAQPAEEPNNLLADETATKVLVYYFRGYVRCITCKKFEAYTQEVINETFSQLLDDGELQWKVINAEEPANRHFIDDYDLVTKSIIISKVKSGKETEWKNLVKIWQLVANKEVFKKYIQDEIEVYMGAN